MTDPLPLDELVARLRDRAADPARRTTSRPSQLMAGIGTMDLSSMLSTMGALGGQLQNLVAANREGRVDPEALATASDIERRMSTPASSVLPAPATDDAVAAFEARTGVGLPPVLRRVYQEVADGGFGPGEGILPLTMVAAQHDELRSPGVMPRNREWPAGLLPLVSMDPGWDCVDAASGRIIAFDPEELDERVSDARWAAAFRQLHPSVEAWLTDWVGSRTQEEVMAEQRARMKADAAYVHIRNLQALTPEQRASHGLHDGWEAEMAAGMGAPWPPPEE